ncbi:MAG: tetratricopeptide repeat protein [Chloroflexi bacterium]|nr:tetratricopeptide repeat protein [Chloroflexota bacterium]
MFAREVEDREKVRKDLAKKAVGLAMQSRWEEAVEVNRSILHNFEDDLEAHNRLGKALSELGRNREAKEAFHRALELSPNNGIAKKNLDRLARLGEDSPGAAVRGSSIPPVFIEESGKAGVTSLVNLASPDVLVKLAPGHPVELFTEGSRLKIAEPSGEYAGQVEPKLASRLTRLIKGGNRYDATVRSVGERELTVIIRETNKDPSQARVVSFPSKGAGDYRAYLPNTILSELTEDQPPEPERVVVKDWSDDDTEPGDDDAYTPVFHRIIKAGEEGVTEEEDL